MKALVVYDSFYGNTEKIALRVGQALGSRKHVSTLRVGQVRPEHLAGLKLLVVGSPTRAFRPTGAITGFLRSLKRGGLKGLVVAAFDTRISVVDTGSRFLKFMVRLFGYAAEPVAGRLQKKGGWQAVPPAGFLVAGTEGPLKDGELERAEQWAREIANLYKSNQKV